MAEGWFRLVIFLNYNFFVLNCNSLFFNCKKSKRYFFELTNGIISVSSFFLDIQKPYTSLLIIFTIFLVFNYSLLGYYYYYYVFQKKDNLFISHILIILNFIWPFFCLFYIYKRSFISMDLSSPEIRQENFFIVVFLGITKLLCLFLEYLLVLYCWQKYNVELSLSVSKVITFFFLKVLFYFIYWVPASYVWFRNYSFFFVFFYCFLS